MAARLKRMGQAGCQTDGDPRTSGPGFGLAVHPDRLGIPLRWKRPRLIFVNSMSDLFHEQVPDEFIDQVFAVMAMAPQHTFQILTKRPERMRAWAEAWSEAGYREVGVHDGVFGMHRGDRFDNGIYRPWPLPNVWLGTSVENQHWADRRIPELLATPAAVRFLSCEPLLGPLDLGVGLRVSWQCSGCRRFYSGRHRETCPDCGRVGYWTGSHQFNRPDSQTGPAIGWVIVGGESGPEHRPMDPEWARSLRDQCAATGVPFFFKQHGGARAGGEALLDGRQHHDMPTVASRG